MEVGRLTIVLDIDSSALDDLTRRLLPQLERLGRAGDDAGERIRQGFSAGADGASEFSKQGTGAMGKLQGIAIGAAALVAPFFIAAGAALALVGAIGAIGIIAIATTDDMQRVFGETKTHIVDSIREIAAPFKEVLLNLNHHFRYAFDTVLPVLKRMMDAVAPLVNLFGENLASAIADFVIALEPAVNAAMPTFIAFSRALKPLLTSLGKTFENLVTPLASFAHQTEGVFVNIGRLFESLGNLIGVLAPLGAMILNAILPAFNTLINSLARALTPVVKALEPVLATLGVLLDGIAQALGPVIEAWGRLIAQGLTVAAPLFNSLALVIVALVQALSPFYVALLDIATMALPVLNPLVSLLSNNLDRIANVINTKVAPAILGFATMLREKAGTAVNWLTTTISTAWSSTEDETSTWQRIKTTIGIVWDEIKAKAVEIWENDIRPWLAEQWIKIKDKAKEIWEQKIKPEIETQFNKIKDWLRENAPGWITSIVTGIISNLPALVGAMLLIAATVTIELLKLVPTLLRIGGDLIRGLISGIVETASRQIGGAIRTVKGLITGAFNGAKDWLFGSGEDVMSGLANGISASTSRAARAVETAAQGAIDAARRKLKTSSPSKVFIGIGESIPQGMDIGISRGMPGVTRAMSGLTAGIPSPLTSNSSGVTGTGANLFFVFNGTVYDKNGVKQIVTDLMPEIQKQSRSRSRSNAGNSGLF